MTYEELFSQIATALPETAGKLMVEKVTYIKEENKAVFFLVNAPF